MTTTSNAPAVPAPVPTVQPPADSRLDQLTAEYVALKPLADEYAARLKAITDGIKAELSTAAPGATKVVLHSSYLEKPLQLSARAEWRLDSKRLKRDKPEIWVDFAYQQTSWRLEQVR